MIRKGWFIAALIAYIITVSGCSFAIEEETTQPENVVELEQQDVNDNKTLISKISYDNVLKKADDHSYDLKIADFNILISKQDVRSAWSEYFPKLNLGAGTEYTKNFRDANESTVMSIGEAFINPYTRYQNMLGITLSYNLFDFGVRRARVDISKEDVKLKELEVKQKMQDLHLDLIDTYSKIYITAKQIELYKQILEIEEKSLELRTRLYGAGEISRTELNDAQVKVEDATDRIWDLYSIFSESLNWLSFYTGEDYNHETLTVEEMDKPYFDIMEFQDYTKSIVWQMHEKELKKKALEVKMAKRNYLPKVQAYSRYYLYGSDHSSYPDSFDKIEPSNFSVGASINMPLFDGFQNSANVRRAELEYKQLQVERDKAIAELATKLAVMRSNLMMLDERMQSNKAAITELKDKNKSLQRLVSKKIVSPLEENDAKVELLRQEIEYEKNRITAIAITKGIQILTEYE